MHLQAVTEQELNVNQSNRTNSVIYLFSNPANANLIASLTRPLFDSVDVVVQKDCVVASGTTNALDAFMVKMEQLFKNNNEQIIKSQRPGWLVQYNSDRNFGCLGVKRHENKPSTCITKLCTDMSNDALNRPSNAAFEKRIDKLYIAKKLNESLLESEHCDQFSEGLFLSWLNKADALVTPSSLIPPRYITEKFIEPITTANNLKDSDSLKASIESFIAGKQYLRYISTDNAISYFVGQVESCCMTQEDANYQLGFMLATQFMTLKTKQLKQQLIRDFCDLCESGNITKYELEHILNKHLKHKTTTMIN